MNLKRNNEIEKKWWKEVILLLLARALISILQCLALNLDVQKKLLNEEIRDIEGVGIVNIKIFLSTKTDMFTNNILQ